MDRGHLPDGWEITTLGNLCNFVRGPFGGSLTKSCFKMSGYAVYEQQHAIYDQFENIRYFIDEAKYLEMKRFELFSGDLIMSCSGTMGKVSIVPDGILKGIINQALLKLSPKKDIVVEFLKYWMNSPNFQMQLNNLSQGVAIKNIASVKILKEIQILKPSVDEQKRIVAILDEAFEGIDQAIHNTEKNLANARELFDSYLNKIFTQKDNGWVDKKLGDVCNFSQGIQVPTELQRETMNGDGFVRFLRIVDFTQRNDAPRYIENPGIKYIVNKRDISLVRYGASTGFVCRGLNGAIANNLFKVLPKQNDLTNEYIYYFLWSSNFQSEIKRVMNGAAMPAISFGLIKNIKILIPSLSEQESVVRRLDVLNIQTQRLETIYRKKIAALKELKQSILQKAFTGQLT